jgi:hypothetical protein
VYFDAKVGVPCRNVQQVAFESFKHRDCSNYASSRLHVEHHQSGISEEALRLITERYEAQLAELRA